MILFIIVTGGDSLDSGCYLLIINERLYKGGQIDLNTKEKIEMEIKNNKTCGKMLKNIVKNNIV